jgi:hypothetical protein
VQFTSRHKEDTSARPEDDHPDFIHAFNAYSPPGDVIGELVYVNYGRVEDIQKLRELGVSLEGKIAISRWAVGWPALASQCGRYGKIFRGNRLANCETAGAIGLIMFSDPAEVATRGVNASQVAPSCSLPAVSCIVPVNRSIQIRSSCQRAGSRGGRPS